MSRVAKIVIALSAVAVVCGFASRSFAQVTVMYPQTVVAPATTYVPVKPVFGLRRSTYYAPVASTAVVAAPAAISSTTVVADVAPTITTNYQSTVRYQANSLGGSTTTYYSQSPQTVTTYRVDALAPTTIVTPAPTVVAPAVVVPFPRTVTQPPVYYPRGSIYGF